MPLAIYAILESGHFLHSHVSIIQWADYYLSHIFDSLNPLHICILGSAIAIAAAAAAAATAHVQMQTVYVIAFDYFSRTFCIIFSVYV